MTQPKVPVVQPLSRLKIERWADGFIAQHFPAMFDDPAPLPVMELFDILLPGQYGIESGIDALPLGIDGISEPPNRLVVRESVYDGMCRGVPRDRFTAAHETFHALKHLGQLSGRFETRSGREVRMYRRDEVPVFRDPEWQANVRCIGRWSWQMRPAWSGDGAHGTIVRAGQSEDTSLSVDGREARVAARCLPQSAQKIDACA